MKTIASVWYAITIGTAQSRATSTQTMACESKVAWISSGCVCRTARSAAQKFRTLAIGIIGPPEHGTRWKSGRLRV